MEKFLALSIKKQDTIRNAALACFAKHGYEKATNEKYIASLVLHEQDYKKFRHPEDAELVFQMLMLLAKGMSVQLENGVDYDGMMKEFREILNMLKHNFYKEEYLL